MPVTVGKVVEGTVTGGFSEHLLNYQRGKVDVHISDI